MARLGEKFLRHGRGEAEPAFDPFEREGAAYAEIPLACIHPDPEQPRKDLGDLEGLKASIQAHGIIQPLVVIAVAPDRYALVTGERRYRAAQALGLPRVPAVVRSLEDHKRLEVQLIENIHRKELNPLEEAASYRRLIEEFGLTQEELGRRIGKSQPSINLTLKLLDLPEPIKADYLTSNNEDGNRPPSKSVLQEIARLPSQEEQLTVWDQAKREGMTVREARTRTVKGASDGARPAATKPAPSMTFRYPIFLDEATVTVTFERPSASLEEVVAVLEQALEGEKARLGRTPGEEGTRSQRAGSGRARKPQ
jgi:ParB/RepB/Spo0J family partition protein